MKKILFTFSVLLFGAQIQAQTSKQFENIITPAGLREKLTFIAGPETQGRESGTPGQRLAASYIENQFKLAGLQPGTPGGYQMVFPVYQDTLLDLSLTVNKQKLQPQKDFTTNANSLTSMFLQIGEVVFASYGILDSSRNDYNGLDVKDKWVLVLEGAPSQNGNPATGMATARMMNTKAAAARTKGAKGIMIVSGAFPMQTLMAQRGGKYVKKRAPGFPVFLISPSVAGNLLSVAADSVSSLAAVTPGVFKTDVELSVYKYSKRYPSTNVLGVIPGTDKSNEYLFITAHYDHIGMQNGVINAGADDDGSGTVSIMQIAEAFAQAKTEGKGPRRSIVFMAVSGEEIGLLGSEFYSDNPIFPLDKTTADLNIDMIGRITPNYGSDSANYVFLIGDDRLSSQLAPISDSANKLVGLKLDRKYNGNDPERFYFRSDHYNFAKKGVPIIFYFNGTHADYHRPGDTIEKINFDLMSKRARLVYHTAWMMANQENMVTRDIPAKTN